ncbi:MAG TPA: CPXCG motif-containing cysteine-rich protein [Gammaproteobacteria bacterium]|nr:CPXCG motif-containing cysteine-rich protein [Gammaproteobacteria bacterium]
MLPSEIVECPYCGESIELIIDDSVADQSYIEDCTVCCRPIEVDVHIDEYAGPQLTLRTDTD